MISRITSPYALISNSANRRKYLYLNYSFLIISITVFIVLIIRLLQNHPLNSPLITSPAIASLIFGFLIYLNKTRFYQNIFSSLFIFITILAAFQLPELISSPSSVGFFIPIEVGMFILMVLSVSFYQPKGVVILSILAFINVFIFYWILFSGNISLFVSKLLMMPIFSATALFIMQIQQYQTKIIQQEKKIVIEANNAKSKFLANVNHELRTPLNLILGFTEILLSDESQTGEKKHLEVIYTAGNNLKSIVDDLIDLTLIENEKLTLHPAKFELTQLISMLEYFKTQTQQKKIDYQISIDKQILHTLYGDIHRIYQVIANIVNNAIKYTKTGGIHLSIELISPLNKELRILVKVSDSGIGIPDEMQEKVFEPFFKGVTNPELGLEGVGLGLSIVKRVVSLMEGEITLESRIGEGSTFFIQFNLQKEELIDQPKQGKFLLKEGLKLLFVDDFEDNLELIKIYLEDQLVYLDFASNGQEAVELVKSKRYDAIIMDIRMPIMDGITATLEIREWEKKNDLIPTTVIALTAYATEEDGKRIVEFNDYLTKPVTKDELIQAISNQLHNEDD